VNIRLSCADFAWRYLDHDSIVELIAALGFRGIDVSLFRDYSVLSLDKAIEYPDEFAKDLTARLDKVGLELVDLFPGDMERFAPNDPDESERSESRSLYVRVLEVARRLAPRVMSLTPGFSFPGDPVREALDRSIEELRWRIDYAGSVGVSVSFEPHQGSVLEDPELLREFLERLPDAKLTLDYGHFIVNGFSQEEIEPFLSRARHLHARGGRKGLVQARLDENTIDWARFVRVAQEAGYEGWIAVEYIHDPRPGGTDCDTLHDIVALKDQLERAITGPAPSGQTIGRYETTLASRFNWYDANGLRSGRAQTPNAPRGSGVWPEADGRARAGVARQDGVTSWTESS
jgi:sugar phosphate isomerase/epimerase